MHTSSKCFLSSDFHVKSLYALLLNSSNDSYSTYKNLQANSLLIQYYLVPSYLLYSY